MRQNNLRQLPWVSFFFHNFQIWWYSYVSEMENHRGVVIPKPEAFLQEWFDGFDVAVTKPPANCWNSWMLHTFNFVLINVYLLQQSTGQFLPQAEHFAQATLVQFPAHRNNETFPSCPF